jgi:hypothetical protein
MSKKYYGDSESMEEMYVLPEYEFRRCDRIDLMIYRHLMWGIFVQCDTWVRGLLNHVQYQSPENSRQATYCQSGDLPD